MAKGTKHSVTSVADGIPFDPNLPSATPTNGFALIYNSTTGQWEARAQGDGSSGVTPPFMFSKSGGTGVGAYLYVGQVVSSITGQLVVGSNKIVKLSVSNGINMASNTTLQLQRRTAIATFVDIAGATVTIPAGSYKASIVLATPIAIGPDWEISAYNKSGSSLNNPILLMYVVPA